MPSYEKMEEIRARASNPETRKPTPNELAREEAGKYLLYAKDLYAADWNKATAAATIALAIMAVEIVN